MTDPSTPIQDCPDVTRDERKAIDVRTPPYDAVRTWGDLLVVREMVSADQKAPKAEKATME